MTLELDTDDVILIASDGTEFRIPMSHAMMSGMLRTMVERKYIKNSRVSTELSAEILGYVCNYFKYIEKCQRHPDKLIKFTIPRNIAKDLMLASTFLDC